MNLPKPQLDWHKQKRMEQRNICKLSGPHTRLGRISSAWPTICLESRVVQRDLDPLESLPYHPDSGWQKLCLQILSVCYWNIRPGFESAGQQIGRQDGSWCRRVGSCPPPGQDNPPSQSVQQQVFSFQCFIYRRLWWVFCLFVLFCFVFVFNFLKVRRQLPETCPTRWISLFLVIGKM